MDAVTLTTASGVDLFAMLGTVLWHVLRIGAALQALPMIGGKSVPARARLLIALAIAASLSSLLPAPPAAAIDAATVLTVVREFAIGIAIGLMLRIAFEAGQLAGELVSQGMGLSFATLANPLSDAASPVLSQWFYLAFGMVFFALDAHLALVRAAAGQLPRAAGRGTDRRRAGVPGDGAGVLRHRAARGPAAGAAGDDGAAGGEPRLRRAVARGAQLNPMSLGLPVSLLVGLALLMLLARELLGPVQALFEQAFAAARAVTG